MNITENIFFSLARFQRLQGHLKFQDFMSWVFDIPNTHSVYTEGEQVFVRFSELTEPLTDADYGYMETFSDVFDDEDTAHHFFNLVGVQKSNCYLSDDEVEGLIKQIGYTVATKYDLLKLADMVQKAIRDKSKDV